MTSSSQRMAKRRHCALGSQVTETRVSGSLPAWSRQPSQLPRRMSPLNLSVVRAARIDHTGALLTSLGAPSERSARAGHDPTVCASRIETVASTCLLRN